MPSILSHPAVPLAIRLAFDGSRIPPRLLATAVVASVLPDIDSLGFRVGIPYGSLLGHRGLTHSLLFALLIAILAMAGAPFLGASRRTTFWVVFVCAVSHGILDASTSGGRGIAFFSPFSNHRYFLPWRPIAVSPIGVSAFLSPWGLNVIASELRWVWGPLILLGLLAYRIRTVGSGA